MYVVYFDQHLDAAHSKNYTKFATKLSTNRKTKTKIKIGVAKTIKEIKNICSHM